MPPPRTLRRKLQKKLKHKPYRLCPACKQRMKMILTDERCDSVASWGDGWDWQLFKVCTSYAGNLSRNVACPRAGVKVELFWSGGGTGRHIPGARKLG